jgi:hypothetical protein
MQLNVNACWQNEFLAKISARDPLLMQIDSKYSQSNPSRNSFNGNRVIIPDDPYRDHWATFHWNGWQVLTGTGDGFDWNTHLWLSPFLGPEIA